MDNSKKCPHCKMDKEKTEFYNNKSYKDGLSSWCKLCHNEAALAYNNSHPEKNNKWSRDHPELNGRWISEHRERWNDYQREYYHKNKHKKKLN